MRCAILAVALWLAALVSIAVAQEPTDQVPLPSLNNYLRDNVDFSTDGNDTIAPAAVTENVFMALDVVPRGVSACTSNPKVLIGVSTCFSQADINTIAVEIDSALATAATITYMNDVINEPTYEIASYTEVSCSDGYSYRLPKTLSLLKSWSGKLTHEVYVNVAPAKKFSLTPDLAYHGFKISTTLDIRVCADSNSDCGSTDVLSATTTGVKAYADKIKVLANCGYITGSSPNTYVSDQNKKQCQCSCSGGREPVNGVCACTGGREFVDGSCKCTGGRSLVGGQCQCTGGQIFQGTECKCPANQHLDGSDCVPDCFWKAGGGGFTCLWSDPTKTNLKLKDDCHVVAPVPNDNYVNDKRTNKYDTQVTDPTISIESTSRFVGSIKDTQKTTWLDYATTPGRLENRVALGAFGVYDLAMVATDYRYGAKCTGCVAVIDDFGPRVIESCKTTNSPANDVAFSTDALARVIADEAKFTAFYAASNIQNNGGFDPVTGANERTDTSSAKLQSFFCDQQKSLASIDDACFTNDYVKDLLDAAQSRSGLATLVKTAASQSTLQCKRCCSKLRTLRESYYEYTCSAGTPEKKTRTTDSCSYGQCLKMAPETLVTASVATSSGSNAKTQTTLNGMRPVPAFNAKEIHRSFKCTKFDQGCKVTPTLGDLFARSAAWGVAVPTGYTVDDFVHWRYSVGTENWKPWSDSELLSFSEPTTNVFVEAWSHCGRVFKDSFKVKLHPHTVRDACKNFASRWRENSPTPRTVDSHMCAYPDSDFVMLLFTYDSAENVEDDLTDKVQGKYTNAQCTVTLAESGALTSAAAAPIPLSQMPRQNGTFTIAKQLGLELVRAPSTAKNTDVKVECTFTFSHYDTQATDDENDPCSYEFTITDCDRPTVQTKDTEGLCAVGQCLSGAGVPGPYEACGGDVFTALDTATTLKQVTSECCSDCKTPLACAATAQSAAVNGIKRCQPASISPTVATMMLASDDVSGVAQPTAQGMQASMLTALAGVSALVAVVALMVVRARTSRAKIVHDDAYVSMLD